MSFRYLGNGGSLKLDEARCTGCGQCLTVCPHAVFALSGERASVAGGASCIECGACMRNCPAGAITVDTGVGCAAAVIDGLLKRDSPGCGCDPGREGGCC